MKRLLSAVLVAFHLSCSGMAMPSDVKHGCETQHNTPQHNSMVGEDARPVYWPADAFPIDVLINSNTSTKYQVFMKKAVETWNQAVEAEVFRFGLTDKDKVSSGAIYVYTKDLGKSKCSGNRLLGLTWRYTIKKDGHRKRISAAKIAIDIDIEYRLLLATMVHELGHAIGLNHDSSKQSILYPEVIPTQHIMIEDVQYIKESMSSARSQASP